MVVLEGSTGSKILRGTGLPQARRCMFEIPVGLFTKSVLDLWPLMKSGGLGPDDHEGASYLVGLAQRFEVLIISTSGEPEAYAVLPGVVDWAEDPRPPFGAAFATTRRPGIRWRPSRPMKGGHLGAFPCRTSADTGFETDTHKCVRRRAT